MQAFMDWLSGWIETIWAQLTDWQKGWLQWLLEKGEAYLTEWIYPWIVQYGGDFFLQNVITNPDGSQTVLGEYQMLDLLNNALDVLSPYYLFLNWVMPLQEVLKLSYLYVTVWLALVPIKLATRLVARFLF